MVTRHHPKTSSPPVLRPLLILFETKALVCHLEIKRYETVLEVTGRNPHAISYLFTQRTLHDWWEMF